MRKTVKKTFWIWSLDKEEEWLNQMAAEGWCLISRGYCRYEFEQVPPGLFTIRTDYLEKDASHRQSYEYIEFIKNTGAVHICTRGRTVYFRKIKDSNFEIISDNPTRIKYYNRILKEIGSIMAIAYFMTIFFIVDTITSNYPEERFLSFLTVSLWTAVGIFQTVGFVKIWRKRKALKEQQNIFE